MIPMKTPVHVSISHDPVLPDIIQYHVSGRKRAVERGLASAVVGAR